MLKGVAAAAGLTPQTGFDLSYAFEHPDEETLVGRMLAPGIIVEAIRTWGEDAVREAIVESLAPYCTPAGSYRSPGERSTNMSGAESRVTVTR